MSEVIYGRNSLLETIRSNPSKVEVVYLMKEDKEVCASLNDNKIKYKIVGKDAFDDLLKNNKLSNVNHQGMIATVKEYKYYNLEDIISNDSNSLIVMLDGLEDPHNLGAIIRTCEISGASGVVIPKNRSVKVTPTVEKVSTGATSYVKVAQVTNLVNTINKLKEEGYWIVGAEAGSESQSFWNVDYKMKICLIIGSEGRGISRLVKEKCDYLVEIPMWGKVNSLNASVSCGILIYEIRRQQNNKQ
ncbi:MAG: 23S rRNA (guanosine(2251)-2'-O)-methyltransferase RlmB [Bacilli bacterium]|nr:23S rRNA (guanosine(2251)-2'-O)-methyltransferase RlmB [Bacilli bacterium]